MSEALILRIATHTEDLRGTKNELVYQVMELPTIIRKLLSSTTYMASNGVGLRFGAETFITSLSGIFNASHVVLSVGVESPPIDFLQNLFDGPSIEQSMLIKREIVFGLQEIFRLPTELHFSDNDLIDRQYFEFPIGDVERLHNTHYRGRSCYLTLENKIIHLTRSNPFIMERLNGHKGSNYRPCLELVNEIPEEINLLGTYTARTANEVLHPGWQAIYFEARQQYNAPQQQQQMAAQYQIPQPGLQQPNYVDAMRAHIGNIVQQQMQHMEQVMVDDMADPL
jgi:hypothetical protein